MINENKFRSWDACGQQGIARCYPTGTKKEDDTQKLYIVGYWRTEADLRMFLLQQYIWKQSMFFPKVKPTADLFFWAIFHMIPDAEEYKISAQWGSPVS